MEGVLVGHLIAPTYAGRQRWLKALADELATRGEVEMLDTSPMFIRGLEVDGSLDPLTAGQIRLAIRWGILRRPKFAHKLNHINTNYNYNP